MNLQFKLRTNKHHDLTGYTKPIIQENDIKNEFVDWDKNQT